MRRSIESCRAATPTYDDIPRLRYVEMVMAESMRLYPPAWAMGRYARNDFQLGEFFLPAKTTVLISQFITHRDATFLSRSACASIPSALRPKPRPAARSSLTFHSERERASASASRLPGWRELLLLATLGQKWKLKSGSRPDRVEPEPLITLRPKYGMRMKVESRTKACESAA